MDSPSRPSNPRRARADYALMSAGTRVLATDADFGARQTLYAIAQDLPGNTFVGPRFGFIGRTQPVGRSLLAKRGGTAAAL